MTSVILDISSGRGQTFGPGTGVRQHFTVGGRGFRSLTENELTAKGYRIWCAEFQSLGDENFPVDVGRAIYRRAVLRIIEMN